MSKYNSIIVIGVPNLGSFHKRITLLLGMQPTCIEPLSVHVRGFTVDRLKRLFEYDNYLRLIDYKGSNFFPLPPSISSILTFLFPKLSVFIFLKFIRTEKEGNYMDVLDKNNFDTYFLKENNT